MLILDPEERAVHWLALADGEYSPTDRSNLIDLGRERLAELIVWP